MENLHLLFNKTLYDDLSVDDDGNVSLKNAKEKSERITNAAFYEKEYIVPPAGADTFCLKTQYPGLLMGTGYAHGISDNEDVKIGFSFDYVTGQPYIPGSSVKGVIRSIFDKTAVIAELLKDNDSAFPEDLNDSDKEKVIEALKNDIFENRDVFLDSVVKKADSLNKVVGFDSITPHSSPEKNPVPLKIVKVLPDVVFEFRFILHDTEITVGGYDYKITKGKKKFLFKTIIKEFGIGAKTNVGYGYLTDVSECDSAKKQGNQKADTVAQNKSFEPAKGKNTGRTTLKGFDAL